VLRVACQIHRKRFHNHEFDSRSEGIPAPCDLFQNVAGHPAVIGSLFDDREPGWFSQPLPNLPADRCKKATINTSDADTGEEVPLLAYPGSPGGIVTVIRVIERQFHEAAERYGAAGG